MIQASRFGVIGNPIAHSISPQIHTQFARQFNANIDYQKYRVESAELSDFVKEFFNQGGRGLNVTLPYKQSVIELVDQLTEEARLAGSVNTIGINQQGLLIGDTTDGRGLLHDLNLQNLPVKHRKILVVGAGGASQSILMALLNAGAEIVLHNRSKSKITQLVKRFSELGKISAFNSPQKFDGVISAVSDFNPVLMAPVKACIGAQTFCYDLNYAQRASSFKQFALSNGCAQFSDGLGMLIGQAAHSYQGWHGQLPDISQVALNMMSEI